MTGESPLQSPACPWPARLHMTPEKLAVAHEHDWYGPEVVAWLLLDASYVSAQLHGEQRRKDRDATPYINHPLSVAHLLMECGVSDPTALCAAILHDVIEDQGVTKEQLARRYGPAVAHTVDEVSDDKSLSKQRRKEMQVEHAPHLSYRAKLVKLADKTRNIEDVLDSPPDWSQGRRLAYLDWAERVVAGMRGTHPALEARFDEVLARRVELAVDVQQHAPERD